MDKVALLHQMANSVDPDHTGPLGAARSVSALFAQTCLSENFETLLYHCKYLILLANFIKQITLLIFMNSIFEEYKVRWF